LALLGGGGGGALLVFADRLPELSWLVAGLTLLAPYERSGLALLMVDPSEGSQKRSGPLVVMRFVCRSWFRRELTSAGMESWRLAMGDPRRGMGAWKVEERAAYGLDGDSEYSSRMRESWAVSRRDGVMRVCERMDDLMGSGSVSGGASSYTLYLSRIVLERDRGFGRRLSRGDEPFLDILAGSYAVVHETYRAGHSSFRRRSSLRHLS
jgi:hypothetical protein